MYSVKILFNDTASKKNKDLIMFLNHNIEHIVIKGQIKLLFKICKTADLKKLRSKGIKGLPAMVDKDNYYIGVPNIITELNHRIKTSKKMATVKNEEEMINDYMNSEIYKGVKKDNDGKFCKTQDEEEEDEFDANKIASAISNELKKRDIDKYNPDYANGNTGVVNTNNNNLNNLNDLNDIFDKPRQNKRPNNIQSTDPVDMVNKMKNGAGDQDDDMFAILMGRISDADNL